MYHRQSSVLASFAQMDRYLHLTKSALDEAANDFFVTVKKIRSSEYEDSKKEEILNTFNDEFSDVNEFPRMLYSSFLVAWYSFVEHNLMQLCNDLNLTITISVQERDEGGAGIQRARRFLSEAAKFEISDNYWRELTNIRQIRNKIVHENGELKYFLIKQKHEKMIALDLEAISSYETTPKLVYLRMDKDFFEYLDSNVLIKFEDYLYLAPDFDYCLDLVNFGRAFFVDIWGGLNLK